MPRLQMAIFGDFFASRICSEIRRGKKKIEDRR